MDQLENLKSLIPQGLTIVFEDIIGFDPDLNVMVEQLSRLREPLIAIIAGAETGVELSDALSERLDVKSNGTALSEA